MIQLGVALGLLIALIGGVIWVVARELLKGSRRRREREARWQAELRQDVATDPRFWRPDGGLAQGPGAPGWAAEEPQDG
jgi:heme exporter protein D